MKELFEAIRIDQNKIPEKTLKHVPQLIPYG